MAAWFALLTVASLAGSAVALTGGGAGATPRADSSVVPAPSSIRTPVDPAAGTGTAADPSRLPGDLSPPASSAVRPRAGWAWPVPEPHRVVRPFDPPEVTWGAGHRGVDLAIAVGGVVRSPAEGLVTFVGEVAGQEVVVVAHADGLRSTFQPVFASLQLGARVAKGEAVGVLTGSSGHCAPDSCVHWGVLRGNVYLDPLGFLHEPVVLLPLR